MLNGKIKSYVFDLDGTLVNTVEDIAYCMNYVLENNGLRQRRLGDYKEWIGAGARNILWNAAPEGSPLELLYEQFMAKYRDVVIRYATLYPGIEQMVSGLRQLDISLVVLSNKDHDLVCDIISRFFPSEPFTIIQGVENECLTKPNPEIFLSICQKLNVLPENAVIIGDSLIDMTTGFNAKSMTMAVEWGYQEREVLQQVRPTFFAEHPNDVLEVVESYLCEGVSSPS